jgi:hypothetical protein
MRAASPNLFRDAVGVLTSVGVVFNSGVLVMASELVSGFTLLPRLNPIANGTQMAPG